MTYQEKAEEAFRKIQTHIQNYWLGHAPFMASYLLKTTFSSFGEEVESERNSQGKCNTIGVAPTKKGLRMTFSPDFILGLEETVLAGVLAHEIHHILLATHSRKGNRIHEIWNIATDYTINHLIKPSNDGNNNWVLGSMKTDLIPQGCFLYDLRDKLKYKGSEISDEIYEFVAKNINLIPKPMDDHRGLSEEALKDPEVQEKLKKLYKQARTHKYGNTSQAMIDYLEGIEKPKLNWKKELRSCLTNLTQKHSHIRFNTWKKLNRRNLPLQGKKHLGYDILVTTDTSGSTASILPEFFGEIDKIAQNYGTVKLIQWDTQVYGLEKYKKGDWKNFKINGYGGTDPQPLFDYMKEKGIKTTPVILTDGYFFQDIELKGYKPIWVVYDNPSFNLAGRVIHIDTNWQPPKI